MKIFEAYKQDATVVIPITVYSNTFRRKLTFFAVRITVIAVKIDLTAKTVWKL